MNIPRRFWLLTLVAIVVFAWLGWLLSIPASEWIEAKWGHQIAGALKHRTYDVSWFVRCRIFDVAWITTLLCVITATMIGLNCQLQRPLRDSRFGRMIALSLIGFVAANIFAFAAMQTATFWLALHTLGPDYRLPSVSAEYQMLHESKTRTKAILMGSSQAPAQINVKVLNERLGTDVQFANLSYIGSQCHDLLMLQNYLQPEVKVVVCYLSEMSFFRGVRGNHVLTLMNGQSEEDLRELKGEEFLPPLDKRYGAVSRAMPLFRARRGIESALFGVAGTPGISFSSTDEQRAIKLKEWNDSFAGSFRNDGTSDFQKRALEKLLRNFADTKTSVVLIAGSLNPLISDQIGPNFRNEMLQFLSNLETQYKNVAVIEEGEELPRAGVDQYRDWTHLRERYRPHYSQVVAELLSRQFDWRCDCRRDAT